MTIRRPERIAEVVGVPRSASGPADGPVAAHARWRPPAPAAATAAGKKRYAVVDLPADEAWQLIEAVTPGLTAAR
ncbi:hypothetical protein [Nocardia gipuzkoensis]|uniref:hypothetical protein n=1 Tax=Nocardia gipuzkoensis TaxID=2749991 RepID=UPI00245386F1|nr:hypothetical protein [Nocardia gipuzkoensis]